MLGRVGDLCNILPFLHRESLSGEKPRLTVAAEFAPVMDGVSYVETIVYPGPHYEIAKAMQEAPPGTICLQVNGPVDQVQKFTYRGKHAMKDSFQKEQWHAAGHMDWWDLNLPLVFDRRNPEREKALIERVLPKRKGSKAKKLILVAAGSISSPFPCRELLWELLNLKFRNNYQLLDLSEVKAERFYDMLALYERAYCLVAVDSAPLHLGRATPQLPVLALTNDRPLLWAGSAWRPNWAWCCRYRDFPTRAVEMFDVIGNGMLSPEGPLPMWPGMFGRDTTGNVHACPATEVAVLPWRDYALHAGSRGRPPAPPGRGRAGSGVVIRFVHRDASRPLRCRPPDHLII